MNRDPLPDRRASLTFAFEHEGNVYRASVGFYPDGRPAELFLNGEKYDSGLDAIASDTGVLISKLLQGGHTVGELRGMLKTTKNGTPASPFGVVLEVMAEL